MLTAETWSHCPREIYFMVVRNVTSAELTGHVAAPLFTRWMGSHQGSNALSSTPVRWWPLPGSRPVAALPRRRGSSIPTLGRQNETPRQPITCEDVGQSIAPKGTPCLVNAAECGLVKMQWICSTCSRPAAAKAAFSGDAASPAGSAGNEYSMLWSVVLRHTAAP